MAQLLRPDICVIGAGAGGLTVAAAASAFGVPVVLIEKGRMGGACLNNGCVPSKALIAAAERVHGLRHGARSGVRTVRFGVDFAAVNGYVRETIDAIAPQDSRERFIGLGGTTVGEAHRAIIEFGDVNRPGRCAAKNLPPHFRAFGDSHFLI